MSHEVRYSPRAGRDLDELSTYILERTGSAGLGLACIRRIRARCDALTTFPEQGTKRARGVRTFGFERRATIVFSVVDTDVRILRVLYGGRHLGRALRHLR